MPNMQTSYSQYQGRAQLGMIATSMISDVVSKTNVTAASAPIPFGMACETSGEDGCVLGSAGDRFAGVSVAQAVLDQIGLVSGAANADQFAEGETVGLLRNGTIWVTAATIVSANDTATYANDGTIGVGLVNAFPGQAYFETDAALGELVRLRLEA